MVLVDCTSLVSLPGLQDTEEDRLPIEFEHVNLVDQHFGERVPTAHCLQMSPLL